jgi:hypothetical protein
METTIFESGNHIQFLILYKYCKSKIKKNAKKRFEKDEFLKTLCRKQISESILDSGAISNF